MGKHYGPAVPGPGAPGARHRARRHGAGLIRILGYWQVKPAGYWFTQVLWSSPSGHLLIGIIPNGRMGVINGNEFTPLNMAPVPSVIMDIGLGAGAGAW